MIYVKGINKSIPTSYSEVDFETYLKLMKCGSDTTKVLSLFTGVDEDTLRKAKITNLDQVIQVLSFVSQEQIDLTPPKWATEKELNFQSIAQYEDVKSIVQTFKQRKDNEPVSFDDIAKFPEICAIYAQTATGADYDYKEAEKLIPLFQKAPCMEVLAMGNFTLWKFINWNLNTEQHFLKQNRVLKKLRQAWTAWRSRLAFTIRYALWKRRLESKGMIF